MVLYFLLLTLASITYAQLQEKHLAESACDLFQSWNQPTHIDTFVHYTLDGEDKSISITSECNERVQDALSICVRNSNFICSELTIEVSLSSQTTKRSHRPDILGRSRSKQTDMSGYCAFPQSALAGSSMAGQSSTSIQLTAASANKMNSATTLILPPSSTGTTSSTTLSLTLSTSPTGGLPMTASSTGAKATSSSRICVIKQADMNSKPPGKCQCSDNTPITFDPLVCEVCS